MLSRSIATLSLVLVMSAASAAEIRYAGKPDAPSLGTAESATRPAVPDDYKINILIRTTIIALNQANATGNYSVLRDLAAPNFQAANSQARLVDIFAALRERKLDLSPILFFDPKLVQLPAIQDDGRLRITGYFDTRPERVIFDLIFENIESDWRLFGVAIDVTPADHPRETPPPAATKKDTNKKK